MTNTETPTSTNELQAHFSTLVLSIASSAAMAMGLAPHPQTGKTEVDLKMAQMNIDLLIMLKDKTKGNLSTDEAQFITAVISDLQNQYVKQTSASSIITKV